MNTLNETNKISKGLDDFLEYLREIESQYNISQTNRLESEDETQDLLHSLELENHSYHETARLGKKLIEVRQKRRIAKDTENISEPIVEWVKENTQVIKSLEKLLGEVRKQENKLGYRAYSPRTDVVNEIE